MQLTPHFTLEEFTRSETARLRNLDNTPSPAALTNLRTLAYSLECVRALMDAGSVVIKSGYRSPAVNRAVGGTDTSAHCLGHAADFVIPALGTRFASAVADRLAEVRLPFDQLLWEPERGILHISTDPRLRGQLKTQTGGPGTPWLDGIVTE